MSTSRARSSPAKTIQLIMFDLLDDKVDVFAAKVV
jgi:hypothetical protein